MLTTFVQYLWAVSDECLWLSSARSSPSISDLVLCDNVLAAILNLFDLVPVGVSPGGMMCMPLCVEYVVSVLNFDRLC